MRRLEGVEEWAHVLLEAEEGRKYNTDPDNKFAEVHNKLVSTDSTKHTVIVLRQSVYLLKLSFYLRIHILLL